jgi:response regulator RpfG family c-di-GMP phosphodiesterase
VDELISARAPHAARAYERRLHTGCEARPAGWGSGLSRDVNNLIQVLNNLLSNAIYSQRQVGGGVITLEIDKDESNLIIRVRDRGVGVSEKIRDRLFREMVTSKGSKGSGLGLYISNTVVRGKFNGSCGWRTTPAAAPYFTYPSRWRCLRCRNQSFEGRAKTMRQHKEDIQSNSFSILTLDDDPIITSTIQAYFQRSGYRVDTERDPNAAIERIRNGHYDILLLDFLMSPICGDQVVAKVREFNSDIFIILLTGHKSMAPPFRTIREMDIQGYYEKSDRFDQLELLVESCVKSIRQLRTIREYKDRLDNAYMEMMSAMRLMVDAKDYYTRGHSDRVSYYAERIARHMGKDEAYCERLRVAGLFHDVGKLGISDGILLKETRLTPAEYEVIKTIPRKARPSWRLCRASRILSPSSAATTSATTARAIRTA